MWLVDINNIDDWPVNNIKITDGKRNIDDFIKECKKLPFIKKLDLDDQKNFFIVLGNALNLNEKTLANTLTIYEDDERDLEEICFPNIKGHIDELFKDYNKHLIYNWEFYIPKNITDVDLEILGIKEVCIYKYNGLIIFKVNENNSIDNESIKKNNIDTSQIRGIYLDLDKNYLSKLFLRSKNTNNYLTLEQYEDEYCNTNTRTDD